MKDTYIEDLEKLVEEKDQRIQELESLVEALEDSLKKYRNNPNVKSISGMTNKEALEYLKKIKII